MFSQYNRALHRAFLRHFGFRYFSQLIRYQRIGIHRKQFSLQIFHVGQVWQYVLHKPLQQRCIFRYNGILPKHSHAPYHFFVGSHTFKRFYATYSQQFRKKRQQCGIFRQFASKNFHRFLCGQMRSQNSVYKSTFRAFSAPTFVLIRFMFCVQNFKIGVATAKNAKILFVPAKKFGNSHLVPSS